MKSLQDFWHMNGIRYNSFAENQEATASWIKMLTHTPTRAQHGTDRKELWLISFVYQSLLGQDRLLRPTAKQVLDKLQDLDLIYPVQNSLGWVAECCSTRPSLSTSSSPFRGSIPQWPILDPLFLDDHLAYLFLDANLEVFAHSKNPTIADGIRDSVSRNLESIVAPEHDRNEIGRAARLMLSSRSLQSRHDLKPLAFHDRISTSMLTGALEEVSFMVVFLNLFIAGKDGIPEMRTVQLSLHTICMERQEDFGRPFFVMVFDPEQWDIRYDVNAPAKTVSLHVHIDTKDLWTDGLPLSASLPNEYTACKSTVSTRQLAVSNMTSSWTIIVINADRLGRDWRRSKSSSALTVKSMVLNARG